MSIDAPFTVVAVVSMPFELDHDRGRRTVDGELPRRLDIIVTLLRRDLEPSADAVAIAVEAAEPFIVATAQEALDHAFQDYDIRTAVLAPAELVRLRALVAAEHPDTLVRHRGDLLGRSGDIVPAQSRWKGRPTGSTHPLDAIAA